MSSVVHAIQVRRDFEACSRLRMALREILLQSGVPDGSVFDAELLSGELVSNAAKYGRGIQIECSIRVDGGRLEQRYRYATDRFDTNQGCSSTQCIGGRGLYLMREISSEEPRWEFGEGSVTCTLVTTWCYEEHA